MFAQGIARNVVTVFSRKSLWWHALAIAITALFVFSGSDWYFFTHTRSEWFHPLIWAAGIGGFFMPVILPLAVYVWGEWKSRLDLMRMGAAVGQAVLISYLVSILYKSLTGRVEPEFLTTYSMIDNSRDFNFGFLEYGVFWGWPSSHTAVAFAMSFVFVRLSQNRTARTLALIYAIGIGLGAAIGFHWLSDVIAGAIFGALVGTVVARSVTR